MKIMEAVEYLSAKNGPNHLNALLQTLGLDQRQLTH